MMEKIYDYMNMLKRRYEKTMHPSYLYRIGLICEKHKIEDPRKYYLAAAYLNYELAIQKINEMDLEEIKNLMVDQKQSKQSFSIDNSNGEFYLIINEGEEHEIK